MRDFVGVRFFWVKAGTDEPYSRFPPVRAFRVIDQPSGKLFG